MSPILSWYVAIVNWIDAGIQCSLERRFEIPRFLIRLRDPSSLHAVQSPLNWPPKDAGLIPSPYLIRY